jgi:pimeloyl-ACP methyl ester carboxylesterase
MPALWDEFTVYGLDLPGMGWTDIVPGARYEEPELRSAVVEFIRTVALLPISGPIFARMENRMILRAVLRGGFADHHALPKDFLGELRRSGRRPGYPTVNRAIMRSLNGLVNARSRYADVSVPVTLVYTERDWSRVAEREQVARLLRNAETVTVPGTGHFSALERPAEMVRIIRRSTGRPVDS